MLFRKSKKEDIVSKILSLNKEYNQNTVIQLSSKQRITFECTDDFEVVNGFIIQGSVNEPETIINLNEVVYITHDP